MMVRLVRACGSKLGDKLFSQLPLAGQARKSLWIETSISVPLYRSECGQARKSLWIETEKTQNFYEVMAWSGS